MLILDAIIPIALVVIIGVLLVKSGYVSDTFFPELSKLVFRVFIPVFLFVSVYRSGLQDVGQTLIAYFIPVLLVFVTVALLMNHRMALTSTFSNNVLVGIPVILSVSGEQGLSITLAVISTHSLILFSAFYLFSSKVNVTPSKFKASMNLFSNPVIIGLLLGLTCNYSGIVIPKQLMIPLEMVAEAALPLALIILGSSLAQRGRIKADLIQKTALVTAIKLLILPLMVYGFGRWVMSLNEVTLVSLVILAACPTGISVMPFVEAVAEDRQVAHSTIAVSTLLSVICIPVTIWLVQG